MPINLFGQTGDYEWNSGSSIWRDIYGNLRTDLENPDNTSLYYGYDVVLSPGLGNANMAGPNNERVRVNYVDNTAFRNNKATFYVGPGREQPAPAVPYSNFPQQGIGHTIESFAAQGLSSFVGYHYGPSWSQNIISRVQDQYAASFVVNWARHDNFYVVGEGWLYAQNAWFGSDSSFKENIQPIDDPLNKVLALEGHSYQFKKETCPTCVPADSFKVSSEEMRTEIGFIAQEVEQIVPELVRTMDDGTKAVAYQNTVALLVEAMKVQNDRIQLLEELVCNCTGGGYPEAGQLQQSGFRSNSLEADSSSSAALAFSPNPATNTVTISPINWSIGMTNSVKLFSAGGNLELSMQNVSFNPTYVLSLSSVSSGFYILEVADGLNTQRRLLQVN